MKQALQLLPFVRKFFHPFEGVAGVGFGVKEKNGLLTSESAWRIYVRKKTASVPLPEFIPPFLFGFSTDVIETSPAVLQSGSSLPAETMYIANIKGVPGTAGCLTYEGAEKAPRWLTNYHVLYGHGAERNDKVYRVIPAGDAPFGPEGKNGALQQKHTFSEAGVTGAGYFGIVSTGGVKRFIDAAVVEPSEDWAKEINKTNWPVVKGMAEAAVGCRVKKNGSASGPTEGIVTDISFPEQARLDYDTHPAPGQILIRPAQTGSSFSQPGDSGSAVLDEAGNIVGLLWGLNQRGEGIACHIAPVAETLHLSFGPPPSPGNSFDRFLAFFKSNKNTARSES